MSDALIGAYKKRQRSLGQGGKGDGYMWVRFKMRKHLSLFEKSSWLVFTGIALHINEDGWAWPSVATLAKETGKDDTTVANMLNFLCDLRIDGARVLLRAHSRMTNGSCKNNLYLLFPSQRDLERYEGQTILVDKKNRPLPKNAETVEAETEEGETEEAEPDEPEFQIWEPAKPDERIKELPFEEAPTEETHTQAEGARAAPAAGDAPGVGVSGGRFADDDYMRYMDECVARGEEIKSRAGLLDYLRSGAQDALVGRVLGEIAAREAQGGAARQRKPADKDCPDCGGRGLWYPEGHEKGVAPCPCTYVGGSQ